MRILKLRFSNLNSLRGDWEIDFRQPPFSECSLFAITGATGAGKTTILDAITLALYGRAARYGGDPNPEQVMSAHTGSCSAEVEFACSGGQAYRSVWQLRRARERPGGKIQSAARRVIALPAEDVLAQKLDESNAMVEELTGLDYQRFLRSVMLAQGEFAAFLHARPAERTELLQQITGTQIYAEISTAAHREAAQADRAYKHLIERLNLLSTFSPEELATRQEELATCRTAAKAVIEECALIGQRLRQAETYRACQAEAARLAAEGLALDRERSGAATEFTALQQHERALPFVPQLTRIDLLQDAIAVSRKAALDSEETIRRSEAELAEAQKGLASAEQKLKAGEHARDLQRPIWEKVATLDAAITRAREQTKQARTAHAVSIERNRSAAKAAAEAERITSRAQADLQTLDQWLLEHAADEALGERFAEIQLRASEWRAHQHQSLEWEAERGKLRKQQTQLQKDTARILEILAGMTKELDALAAEGAAAATQISSVAEGRSLAEWQAEREAAQVAVVALERLLEIAADYTLGVQRNKEAAHALSIAVAALRDIEQRLPMEAEAWRSAGALSEARRKILEGLQRMQAVEQHRTALVAGEPCPLCGAADHPYAGVPVPAADEMQVAQAALQEAIAGHEQARLRRETTSLAHAASTADIARIQREIAESAAAVERQAAAWRQQAATIRISSEPGQFEALPDFLSAASARVAKALERTALLHRHEQRAAEVARLRVDAQGRADRQQMEKALLEQTATRLERDIESASIKADALQKLCVDAAGRVSDLLAPFGESIQVAAEHDALLARLKRRVDVFCAERDRRRLTAADLAARTAALLELRKVAEAAATQEKENAATLDVSATHLNTVELARQELFGSKVVEHERDRIETELAAVRSDGKSAGEMVARLQETQRNARKQSASLAITLQKSQADMDHWQHELSAGAHSTGFLSLADLRAAVLPADRGREIAALKRRIEHAILDHTTRQTANASAMQALPSTASEDLARHQELQSIAAALDLRRNEGQQRIGALELVLQQDARRRLEQATLQEQTSGAHAEFLRWSRLSQLIGSANGTAFSRFAQELTLDRLVQLANRHLAQLNPRYALRRADESGAPLEIQILDHYQANAIRSMRSLSGGESFLASLALALSMSDLASGRTAIDSMFIDEGFGTLDTETLEVAMAALENLQASGKTIGVISHVDSMKERITTQLRILKGEGGCSRLEIAA